MISTEGMPHSTRPRDFYLSMLDMQGPAQVKNMLQRYRSSPTDNSKINEYTFYFATRVLEVIKVRWIATDYM